MFGDFSLQSISIPHVLPVAACESGVSTDFCCSSTGDALNEPGPRLKEQIQTDHMLPGGCITMETRKHFLKQTKMICTHFFPETFKDKTSQLCFLSLSCCVQGSADDSKIQSTSAVTFKPFKFYHCLPDKTNKTNYVLKTFYRAEVVQHKMYGISFAP